MITSNIKGVSCDPPRGMQSQNARINSLTEMPVVCIGITQPLSSQHTEYFIVKCVVVSCCAGGY